MKSNAWTDLALLAAVVAGVALVPRILKQPTGTMGALMDEDNGYLSDELGIPILVDDAGELWKEGPYGPEHVGRAGDLEGLGLGRFSFKRVFHAISSAPKKIIQAHKKALSAVASLHKKGFALTKKVTKALSPIAAVGLVTGMLAKGGGGGGGDSAPAETPPEEPQMIVDPVEENYGTDPYQTPPIAASGASAPSPFAPDEDDTDTPQVEDDGDGEDDGGDGTEQGGEDDGEGDGSGDDDGGDGQADDGDDEGDGVDGYVPTTPDDAENGPDLYPEGEG